MKLSNNTVLITGGASGIGFALAKAFIESKNTVIICGRDRDKLHAAKEQLPQLTTFYCDITKTQDLSELQAQLSTRFPKLNMLINNAGMQQSIDFTGTGVDETRIDREIDTNLTAHIKLTNRLLPLLSSQDTSRIVFIGSALGRVTKHSTPIYSATKAAVHSFAESLRHQLANTSTKVTEVIPDLVATSMTQDRQNTKKMHPATLAKSVLRGIRKNNSKILVGRTRLLFGLHRLTPKVAERIINKPQRC
ncbi:MAG: SDR family NAD(P)-dependent oxidoreductase [Gammaproteobacteria bacterium]|nr:SDR family NAD(P)-dependent oxidoreductase [Gammaproteobacteria bacterium]